MSAMVRIFSRKMVKVGNVPLNEAKPSENIIKKIFIIIRFICVHNVCNILSD